MEAPFRVEQVSDGYIWGSIVTARGINCDGYFESSLFGGIAQGSRSDNADLRNSIRFDSESVYKHLRK